MTTPVLLLAHGDGASYETEVDSYMIDIGYDPAKSSAGERVRFDFNAYPKEAAVTSSTSSLYTDVWVSIEQAGELVFSGGIDKPVFGATGFNLVLPNEGEYLIKARFQNNGTKVAEASFPLMVTEGVVVSEQKKAAPIIPVAVTALIALASGYLVGRRKHHAST